MDSRNSAFITNELNKMQLNNNNVRKVAMVDFHGLSPAQAQASLNSSIQHGSATGISSIRVVTGRGNHPTRKGERGVLKREFPNWFTDESLKKISSIRMEEGYYEVILKRLNSIWLQSDLEEVQKLAQEGDANHQGLLGYYYQYIAGGEEANYKLAVAEYEKSAKAGNSFAQYLLGGCYWQGVGIRQDDQKALELFEASADKGFPWAFNQLGDIYYYGMGAERNPARGREYYQKGADLGLDIAKRKLAYAYLTSNSVEEKPKAFTLYKEVADRGDVLAAYNVGYCYLHGVGVSENTKEAAYYLKQAADAGNADSQYLLSTLYRIGDGVPLDARQYFDYLRRAANNEHMHALLELAMDPQLLCDESVRESYLLRAAHAGQIFAQALIMRKSFSSVSEDEIRQIRDAFWKQDNTEVLDIADEQMKRCVVDTYVQDKPLTKKQRKKAVELLNGLEGRELGKDEIDKYFTKPILSQLWQEPKPSSSEEENPPALLNQFAAKWECD